MKFGGGYTKRAMDAQYSNPTNGDAQFWTDVTAVDLNAAGTAILRHNVARLSELHPPRLHHSHVVRPPASLRTFFQDDWRVPTN